MAHSETTATMNQLQRLEEAAQIQALWAQEAGIRPDLFYDSVPEHLSEQPPQDIRNLVEVKLEEWGELIMGLVQPEATQASRLLEIADVEVYSLQYVPNIRQRTQPDQPTMNRPQSEAARTQLAQHMAVADILPLPDKVYTPEQLMQRMKMLQEVIVEDICQHFEIVGFHPNGSTLAEIKRADVQRAVAQGMQQVAEAAMQGKATKQLLQHVSKSMVAYAENLPHIVRPDAQIEDLLPMLQNLAAAAQLMFAYEELHVLAASLNVRATVTHPVTGLPVEVAGKNARNYAPLSALPVGWDRQRLRRERDQFPDSIIPSGYRLGVDTPQAFMQQYPERVGAQQEVRRFDEDALR